MSRSTQVKALTPLDPDVIIVWICLCLTCLLGMTKANTELNIKFIKQKLSSLISIFFSLHSIFWPHSKQPTFLSNVVVDDDDDDDDNNNKTNNNNNNNNNNNRLLRRTVGVVSAVLFFLTCPRARERTNKRTILYFNSGSYPGVYGLLARAWNDFWWFTDQEMDWAQRKKKTA